jgi:hypothetical protein
MELDIQILMNLCLTYGFMDAMVVVKEETMSRYEKRKAERQAANIVATAKKDMIAWVETLEHTPSELEMKAWQAGYVSGMNRLVKVRDETSD